MSEFLTGRVSVSSAGAAVKIVDVPASPGSGVVLHVMNGSGVYVGHDNTVSQSNGLFVAAGEKVTLPVSVPDGQTAPIWVKGAGAASTVAFFVGAAV